MYNQYYVLFPRERQRGGAAPQYEMHARSADPCQLVSSASPPRALPNLKSSFSDDSFPTLAPLLSLHFYDPTNPPTSTMSKMHHF